MATAWTNSLVTPQARGPALSFDEWLALDEDEPGELVDGFLEKEEVPDSVHELTVTWLSMVLCLWLGPRGFVLGSEAKLKLQASSGRKPDLSVYLPGTPAPPRRGALTAPPDIVIEVVTPTARDERRDRVEKRLDYARFGVRWYWIVDPAFGSVEILQLEPDGFYKVVVTGTAGVLDSIPGCEGLRVDLDALWAELGRLGPEE